MMSDWSTRATTVIVSGDGQPCGRTYRYDTPAEARRQFTVWVDQAIRFVTDGVRWSDIQLGARIVRVRGYDSGRVSVYEQLGTWRWEWDPAEVLRAQ
jgi:hypothetical protein